MSAHVCVYLQHERFDRMRCVRQRLVHGPGKCVHHQHESLTTCAAPAVTTRLPAVYLHSHGPGRLGLAGHLGGAPPRPAAVRWAGWAAEALPGCARPPARPDGGRAARAGLHRSEGRRLISLEIEFWVY